MRGLSLRKSAIRLLLGSMDQVRKLYRVLDEEYRDVVPNDVPITLLGVDLDREAPYIARQIGRTLVPCHRRETHEERCLLTGTLKQISFRNIRLRFVIFEEPVRSKTPRVNDSLRDAFMIEMKNLLPEMEILQRSRSAGTDFQGVLIISYRDSLLGG